MEKVSMFGVFESHFLNYNQLYILVCICVSLISHFISRLLRSKSLFKLINYSNFNERETGGERGS